MVFDLAWLAFYAFQSGIAVINVHDKVGGKHVFVPVPVGLVNTGFEHDTREMLQTGRGTIWVHIRKIVQDTSNGIGKIPDTDFVEIQTKRERILVSKNGRNLIIDVILRKRASMYVFRSVLPGAIVAKLARFSGNWILKPHTKSQDKLTVVRRITFG